MSLGIGSQGISLGAVLDRPQTLHRPTWLPSLDLDLYADFSQGQYWDGRIATSSGATDTHAQAIYMPNASGGLVEKAANLLMREDGVGLQTVPTRTNLCLYANDITNSAYVLTSGATKTGNALAAPDGTMTADLLTYGDGTLAFQVYQIITVAENTQYTYSYYALLGTKLRNRYAIYNNTAGSFIIAETTASGVTTGAWTRVTVTFTTPAGCTGIRVYPDRFTANLDGPTGSTIYIWGQQLEAGAFATPLIVTTSTASQRNGNQPLVAGLGDQLSLGGVSFFVKVNLLQSGVTSQFPRMISFSDGTFDNEVSWYLNSAGSLLIFVRTAGVTTAEFALASGLSPGTHTFACSIGSNFATGRRVGSLQSPVDTSVEYPSIDQLSFGGRGHNASSNLYQMTTKFGVKFGPQDQASFDEMYTLAQSA